MPRNLAMTNTPVSSVLSRIAYELHSLADATDEFHHLAFGGERASLDDADFVRATQSIDLTQQILANLSQFVECLAMAAPEDWDLDTGPALTLVTLGDLRQRLSETAENEADRQEAGDADLFF